MKAFKGLFILWGWVMLFASGAGSAAPIVLLDLNFDAVPGLDSRTSVVSGEALLAWLPPGSAAGSPEEGSWVNVRRHDNAIDGTSSGESAVHFDNFYTSGNFLVIGDRRGDLRGSEAGTSQLLVPFGVPAGSRALAISFDWVFDTTDDAGANADDFEVHLLAGGAERELLSIGRPEHNGATRGVFFPRRRRALSGRDGQPSAPADRGERPRLLRSGSGQPPGGGHRPGSGNPLPRGRRADGLVPQAFR
ncbi:MAG: hypothetical protein KatS3mg123_2913 [Burkholderiales bacterium]|nr:MAG: hypothetical protein KatS3mg123_2913 [Burkholderiales bacterium]